MNVGALTDAIRSRLGEAGVTSIAALDVLDSVDSTNSRLMNSEPVRPRQISLCIAAAQTAGRGRRGRQWVSPAGSGVYLSMGWTFHGMPKDISTLSLVVGVAVKRALDALGATGVRLKWPNDIVVPNGKLGGVLVEMRTVAEGAYVVIGVGINLRIPPAFDELIATLGGQPPRDLLAAGIDEPDFVNTAVGVIARLNEAIQQFEQVGMAAFREEWRQADSLYGCAIQWMQGDTPRSGIARGIEVDGSLLVETDQGVDRLVSGEVSLRRVA